MIRDRHLARWGKAIVLMIGVFALLSGLTILSDDPAERLDGWISIAVGVGMISLALFDGRSALDAEPSQTGATKPVTLSNG